MPNDDPNPAPPPFRGFRTYADDDTPLRADAWSALVERDSAGPPDWDPSTDVNAARAEPPRGGARTKAAVAAAVLLAFGGGFVLARADRPQASAPPPTSEAAALAAAPPMNVQLAQAPPPPLPPAATDKLEVLAARPGPATALSPRAPSPATRETPVLSLSPPTPAPAPAPAPAPREMAQAPTPRDAVAVAPAPLRAPYDCRDAPTRARAMVCRDAGLAAMDRRMKQAYAAAVAAGAPRDDLAADQEDWLDVREEAAVYSRRAVADIYRQRIDELDAMAGVRRD